MNESQLQLYICDQPGHKIPIGDTGKSNRPRRVFMWSVEIDHGVSTASAGRRGHWTRQMKVSDQNLWYAPKEQAASMPISHWSNQASQKSAEKPRGVRKAPQSKGRGHSKAMSTPSTFRNSRQDRFLLSRTPISLFHIIIPKTPDVDACCTD